MFRFFESLHRSLSRSRRNHAAGHPGRLLLALLPAGLALARRVDGGRPHRLADRSVDPALHRLARRHAAHDEPGARSCTTMARASRSWGRWSSSRARWPASRMISSTQQAIAPGMTNLIRWQTHRYVLRQSMSYFANDFAGRIASNIVQAAPSLRESIVQVDRRAVVRRDLRGERARHLRAGRLAPRLPARAVDARLRRGAVLVRAAHPPALGEARRMRARSSPAASSTATPTSRR